MKIYSLFIISLLLGLNSCVTILHSLVTRDNVLTDKHIVGTWVDTGSRNILVQELMKSKFKADIDAAKEPGDKGFTPEDSVFYSKLYVVSYRENKLDYTWIAGLVKIKDQYYLNLVPEECIDSNGMEIKDLGETTSSIAKLTWNNEKMLTLNFLNGNNIKEIILTGKAQIKYEFDPLFETFVITASSGELKLFLEKYGNDERLFRGGNVIILTSKS